MKKNKRITSAWGLALASLIMVVFAACGSSAPAATLVPTATPTPKANIAIEDAWARPAAMVMAEGDGMDSMDSTGGMDDMAMSHSASGTGAVYFKMINTGNAPDTLVAVLDARVTSPGDVAGVAELHESTMTDGVMAMHKVSGVEVPAGGTTELKPGSFHVMLLEIKRDLTPGDKIILDVRFQSGTEQTIVAEVREP